MTSPTTTIHTPFADGRTVRDIVEHSPALVNETWCRDLLQSTLDSLERQYATGAPHRPISPDTIVMLANKEPLLLPAAEDIGAASAPTMAADLHALALVVHYAITAELPPDGPLGPRLYDNYSSTLTNGLDRCLGPNMRLRPKTAEDMRALLGIEAGSSDAPIHAAPPAAVPVAASAPPQAAPVPSAPVHVPAAPVEAAPVQATPVHATPVHATPVHAAAEPLLRTPAAASAPIPGMPDKAASASPATTLEAATAARLNEEAARTRAPAAAPRAGSGLQRWGWIAGAALVLLAAGTALVSYLDQREAAEAAALALPPAEPATSGLAPGETVVAPTAAATELADAPPAGEIVPDPNAATLPADTPGTAPSGLPSGVPPAAGAAPARPGEAIVNGTTYKLVIKPWGTVYVDGIDRGVSPPVKRLTLGKGLHTIQIVNPNFPDHVLTVDAGSRESTTITHDFTTAPNRELP